MNNAIQKDWTNEFSDRRKDEVFVWDVEELTFLKIKLSIS